MKIPAHTRISNSAAKRWRRLDHALGARFRRTVGVSARAAEPELVVSLTTIAERVSTIHLCLDSLLRQTRRPDRLVLWLNRTEAPDRPRLTPETLPRSLTRLLVRGLTIEWCEDLGPHCKLLPALRRFPRARIATADDDILYAPDWLASLAAAQEREPACLHCHRGHLMRYAADGSLRPYAEWGKLAAGVSGATPDLFPTGVGGVLYAPGDLAPEVFNAAAFRALCPRADDVWFKAMSLLAGKACRLVPHSSFRDHRCELKVARRHNLRAFNVAGGGNDRQLRAVAARYPVFRRAPGAGGRS
ncbi:MAG: hypothetical protein QM691_15760 [Opitutaceae bacterium]